MVDALGYTAVVLNEYKLMMPQQVSKHVDLNKVQYKHAAMIGVF